MGIDISKIHEEKCQNKICIHNNQKEKNIKFVNDEFSVSQISQVKMKLKIIKKIASGSCCDVYLVRVICPDWNYLNKYEFAMKATLIDEEIGITKKKLVEEFKILERFSSHDDLFKVIKSEMGMNVTFFESEKEKEEKIRINQESVIRVYGQPFIIKDLDKQLYSDDDEEVEEEEYYCFLMEVCEFSLKCLLGMLEKGIIKIPLDFKVWNIIELFECLDYCHSAHNIIHRDIRPYNVMVFQYSMINSLDPEFNHRRNSVFGANFINIQQTMHRFEQIENGNLDNNDGINYRTKLPEPFYCMKIIDFGRSSIGERKGQNPSGIQKELFTDPVIYRSSNMYGTNVDVWSLGICCLLLLCNVSEQTVWVKIQQKNVKRLPRYLAEFIKDKNYEKIIHSVFMDILLEKKEKMKDKLEYKRLNFFVELIINKMLSKDSESRLNIRKCAMLARLYFLKLIVEEAFERPNKSHKIIYRICKRLYVRKLNSPINNQFMFKWPEPKNSDLYHFCRDKEIVVLLVDTIRSAIIQYNDCLDDDFIFEKFSEELFTHRLGGYRQMTIGMESPKSSYGIKLSNIYTFIHLFYCLFHKKFCSICLKVNPKYHCGSCKLKRYCSKECQRKDWTNKLKSHKILCKNCKKIKDFCNRWNGLFPKKAKEMLIDIEKSLYTSKDGFSSLTSILH